MIKLFCQSSFKSSIMKNSFENFKIPCWLKSPVYRERVETEPQILHAGRFKYQSLEIGSHW